MAENNKRTIYLGLDYTDFTGGVSEVNRKMSLLDTEFKLAQEQAKNYGNETDKLGVKHDYLKQKIELQNKKLEEAQKAYDNANNSTKTSQKEIDLLLKKLIQEKTSLERLQGDLGNTEDSIDDLNNTTKSFGDSIRDMANNLGIEVSPALENMASKFDGVNKQVGESILVIGAAVTALVGFSKDAAVFADDLLTLSTVTGIATDDLQKLQYASDFVDVSVETLSDGLKEITNKMYEASQGSKEASEMFKKLHIRITDGNNQLRNANDVFYDTIDALGRVKNETERDAMAMKLMGESARNLNPLIEAGSQKLRDLGIEAEDMGVIMSGQSLQDLVKMKDEMDKFDKTTDALKNNLGLALLPVLSGVFGVISSIPTPLLTAIAVFSVLALIAVKVAGAVKSVAIANATLSAANVALGVTGATAAAGMSPLLLILLAIAAVIALIVGGATAVKNSLKDVEGSISETSNSLTNAVNQTSKNTSNMVYKAKVTSGEGIMHYNASGDDNFVGGRTWVGEAGPEIIDLPYGTKITPNGSIGRTEYNNFYVTIDAHNVDDFNRVIQLAKQQKMALRRV